MYLVLFYTFALHKQILISKKQQHEKMRRAAALMAAEYSADPELTALTTARFEEDPTDAAQ